MAVNEIEASEMTMARQVITASLAEAWRRPVLTGSLSGCSYPFPRDAVRAAWDLLLLDRDPLAFTSSQKDTKATTADVDSLIAWFELDPFLRERAIDSVFGLVIPRDYPPYETEYLLWNDATHRAQHLADIAGFYQAFGLEPDHQHPERHDHLSLELGFVAFLFKKITVLNRTGEPLNRERIAITTDALVTFLRDHLLWWVPRFACGLNDRIRDRGVGEERQIQEALHLLAGVTRLLDAWVALIRDSFSLEASSGPRPLGLPIAVSGPADELEEMECSAC